MTSSAVTNGDATQVIATGNTLFTSDKSLLWTLLREATEVGNRHLTSRVARWFLLANWHGGIGVLGLGLGLGITRYGR